MNLKIYIPNIHLFAFSPIKKSERSPQKNEINSDWLWGKCDGIISKVLHDNFQIEQYLDLEIKPDFPAVSLNKFPAISLNKHDSKADPYSPIYVKNQNINAIQDSECLIDAQASVYALRIYDNYGIGLNVRRPKKENGVKFQSEYIKNLNLNPQNCFILEESEHFLGQTLLITATLSSRDKNKNQEDLKILGDKCLEPLFPADYRIPPFNRAGELFGCPIFEYGIFRQLTTYRHILVWFFCEKTSENKFEICYNDLLDLFFFRAKVIHAYKTSHETFPSVKKQYNLIEKEINKVLETSDNPGLNALDLEEFNNQLIQLPRMSLEYAEQLRDVEEHLNDINVNTRNYLEKLQEIQSVFPHDDLSFLAIFGEKRCPYFQEQIKAELGYFQRGFDLVDKALASIRGQVAIAQAKLETVRQEKEASLEDARKKTEKDRDFNQQITILAVGSGIGVGGIISSSFSSFFSANSSPQIQTTSPCTSNLDTRRYLNFAETIGYGLIGGIIVMIAIWLLSRKFPFIQELFEK